MTTNNIPVKALQMGVPDAFDHFRKNCSAKFAKQFTKVRPWCAFDPIIYETVTGINGCSTVYHRMIILDDCTDHWCMTWESNIFGQDVKNEVYTEVFLSFDQLTKGMVVFNKGNANRIPLGPSYVVLGMDLASQKEEYGVTCTKCKQHNEYAIRVSNHVCRSCKSYQTMYSGD